MVDRVISMARSGIDGRANFRKVASTRLDGVIRGLRLLGNMAGGNTFEVHSDDVDRLERAITSELQNAMARLRGEQVSLSGVIWED